MSLLHTVVIFKRIAMQFLRSKYLTDRKLYQGNINMNKITHGNQTLLFVTK